VPEAEKVGLRKKVCYGLGGLGGTCGVTVSVDVMSYVGIAVNVTQIGARTTLFVFIIYWVSAGTTGEPGLRVSKPEVADT